MLNLSRMAILYSLVIISVFPACAFDSKCDLDVAHAPSVIGLRLGMEMSEVQSRLPHLRVTEFDYGSSKAELQPTSLPHINRGGVAAELDFLDGKLYSIKATYYDDTEWKEYEFKNEAEKQLGLKQGWLRARLVEQDPIFGHPISDTWVCECKELRIVITEPGRKGRRPQIEVLDTATLEYVVARRDAGEREGRQKEQGKFKP